MTTPAKLPPLPDEDVAPAPAARPARSASDTRARILAAARLRFSRDAFENVGTRDIAGDAGVDAALVSRYFGSKDGLFEAVLEGAFRVEDHWVANMASFGEQLAGTVMQEADEFPAHKIDALGLLLRASGSPATVAIVSERFDADFVQPLARLLHGRDAELRAALIASYAVGLATMKHALGSPALDAAARGRAVTLVGAAIQACVSG